MDPKNHENHDGGQMRTVIRIHLSAAQVSEDEPLNSDGGQMDRADGEFQILVLEGKNYAHAHAYISLHPPFYLSICPPICKQPAINTLRADRCEKSSVRHLSASVRLPAKRKIPGYWTVRERLLARGLKASGAWIGGVSGAADRIYFRRTGAMPIAERRRHHELTRQSGYCYLFPDGWLDLLDAAIDRVCFKIPMPKGVA